MKVSRLFQKVAKLTSRRPISNAINMEFPVRARIRRPVSLSHYLALVGSREITLLLVTVSKIMEDLPL